MAYQYDVIIIGAGPGGYETAIRLSQLGQKVCIVEEKHFGGTCLNVGCIPTKALLKSAEVFRQVRAADQYGIQLRKDSSPSVDMSKVQKRKAMVVDTLVKGVESLLQMNGVDKVLGHGQLKDPHTVSVEDQALTAENIILATGSSPVVPHSITLEDGAKLSTSTEILNLDYLPSSLAIIGAGVIGIEMAYLFSQLGTKVTVLEALDRILPPVDDEIAALIQKQLRRSGITFRLGANVLGICGKVLRYRMGDEEKTLEADEVLASVGRVPNTQGLNAEGLGLAFEGRGIQVDDHLRTSIPNIFAIGDVTGKDMLAHTASHEGMVAAANICGGDEVMDYTANPSCIYMEPELASVGLTERQAREQYGEDIRVGSFPMTANGRSLIEGCRDGLFKVLMTHDGKKILGAHLYGPHATEMIGEVSMAITGELDIHQILRVIQPHPSVSEAMGEAWLKAWNGKSINFT